MKVWVVANQKGGVGKTTSAVTLAGLLAEQGHTILLADMDPHGSLTSYFGYDPDTTEGSIYRLFEDMNSKVAPLVKATRVKGLYLLLASTAMATLDRQLGARGGMGLIIKRALAQVSDKFDYVLIDCPPVLGILLVNALAACDHLIIPVQTEFLALKGLERMLHTLDMVARSRKYPLQYTIVPTLFDRRTRASLQTLETLRERYADNLWESVIPVDTQFREASRAGIPVSQLAPQARGAMAYAELLSVLTHKQDIVQKATIR